MFHWCTWKNNTLVHDDGSSGGVYPIPLNSTTGALVSLSATINFIGCCLQALERNVLELCNMYFFYEKHVSENSSWTSWTTHSERKTPIIITCCWRWLVYEQITREASTPKEIKLSKRAQEKEDEIKRKLHKDNQDWYYWKIQIHWNKIEWVNPRNRNEQKSPFCVSSKLFSKIIIKLHIWLVTCN